MKLSEKQRVIIEYIRSNGNITKQQAVQMLGKYYYHNGEKYVGEILSNMVKRRYIKRIKNGVFEIGSMSNQVNDPDKDQTSLF